MFNGFVDQNKKIPQFVHFRCGRAHNNKSSKKMGKSDKLKKIYLKKK